MHSVSQLSINQYRYTSRDGADAHTKTFNFDDLMNACTKESVFGKDPYLVYTKTVGGYDWDREKI